MNLKDLNTTEFNAYYAKYINKLLPNTNLVEGFKNGADVVLNFFQSIPSHKLEYRYDIDKWSIKEILQHLIDTERIFMYRCFRIARHDTTALAGYDQNMYIEPSHANEKSIDALIEEFKINRQNSISILNSLNSENLKQIGAASGFPISARAAAFIIIGHDIWHMDVIKERYL